MEDFQLNICVEQESQLGEEKLLLALTSREFGVQHEWNVCRCFNSLY